MIRDFVVVFFLILFCSSIFFSRKHYHNFLHTQKKEVIHRWVVTRDIFNFSRFFFGKISSESELDKLDKLSKKVANKKGSS